MESLNTDKKKPSKYGQNRKLSLGITGIYFLRYSGNIVYVGQSKCIMSRIVKHNEEKKKLFDSYTWKPFYGSDMQRKCYEKKLIKQLNPKYNVVHNTKSKRKSKSVYLVLSK